MTGGPRTDGGRQRCPDCCRAFDSEDELREHAEKYHDGLDD